MLPKLDPIEVFDEYKTDDVKESKGSMKPEQNAMVLLNEDDFKNKYEHWYYFQKFSETERYPNLEDTVNELWELFPYTIQDLIK